MRLGTKKPSGRPFQRGHPKMGGRKKGVPNKVPQEIKEFFKEFVSSPEYQQNLKQRILDGRATQIETVGLYYTAGKPKETHEVATPTLSHLLKLALSKPDAGD